REIPRLCRGGSKSLTVPEVGRAVCDRPSTKLCLASRQAHEGNSIDGRCRGLKERVPFAMPSVRRKEAKIASGQGVWLQVFAFLGRGRKEGATEVGISDNGGGDNRPKQSSS